MAKTTVKIKKSGTCIKSFIYFTKFAILVFNGISTGHCQCSSMGSTPVYRSIVCLGGIILVGRILC